MGMCTQRVISATQSPDVQAMPHDRHAAGPAPVGRDVAPAQLATQWRIGAAATTSGRPDLRRFGPWLLAAAIYNAAWGTFVVLAPTALFDLLALPPPEPLAYWQVVGMMVLTFAPAYWWAARDPWAHRHIVLIGLAGKVLGTIGFVGAALTGQLPWAFGLVVLTNDLVWLPTFGAFVVSAAGRSGWRALLVGD